MPRKSSARTPSRDQIELTRLQFSDKTGRRGLVVLFGVLCQWTFMVAFRGLPDNSSAGLKFGILTMGTATCSWWRKSLCTPTQPNTGDDDLLMIETRLRQWFLAFYQCKLSREAGDSNGEDRTDTPSRRTATLLTLRV